MRSEPPADVLGAWDSRPNSGVTVGGSGDLVRPFSFHGNGKGRRRIRRARTTDVKPLEAHRPKAAGEHVGDT